MSFSVSEDVDAIAAAINEFNANYHTDYANVRVEAIRYLSEPLSTASAERLAGPLVFAMKSWGAGKRKAS